MELRTSSLAENRKRGGRNGGKWFDSFEGMPYPAAYVIENTSVDTSQNVGDSGFNSGPN